MSSTSTVVANSIKPNVQRKLRSYNIAMGVLHAAQAIAVLVLSNSFALPVEAKYLAGPPGSGATASATLFEIRTAWIVAAFFVVSSMAHLLISSGSIFRRYVTELSNHMNSGRWIEYSISSSLMIVIIAQLCGISDVVALVGIVGVNASMIFFGWLQERYEQPGNGNWLPFIMGCFAGAIPWIGIAIYVIAPGTTANVSPPGFVYAIVLSLFIFFNVFALNQWLQYRKIGRWKEYLFGERAYIALSLVAKSALAWQIFSGTLAG